MPDEMDPSVLQDFLTESGELLDQLDADLITLENATAQTEQLDTLNSIFRAVHTIKGAAGFLGIESIMNFAHAAEDALNLLRQGDHEIDASLIDTLLRSADVLRNMIEALGNGDEVPAAPEALLAELRRIASGDGDSAQAAASETTADAAESAAEMAGASSQPGTRQLNLSSEKQALLTYVGEDLREVCQGLAECGEQATDEAQRANVTERLDELNEGLAKTADFFELSELQASVDLIRTLSAALPEASDEEAAQTAEQLRAVQSLLQQQADALEEGRIIELSLEQMQQQVNSLLAETNEAANQAAPATEAAQAAANASSNGASSESRGDEETAKQQNGDSDKRSPEQTIRVEVGRLEKLLNLVGQMVLSKNRILGIGRKLQHQDLPQDLIEQTNSAINELDRFTGELQMGVMQTRMQPLAKVFDRYPRVIRDVARSTGKKIQLQITGKETEVDKGVLELLADPLVHVLRNSADHGIESPEQRVADGKPETGTIHLSAEHRGSHVHVAIRDDGRGLEREVIASKALANGLTTEEQLAALSDQEVYEFIFSPGFSTADQISDLSGRGVGMDVVRTNVNKMNGSIHIDSTPGQGTEIAFQIPLTVAIMPAMALNVGDETYCVPLQNIVEIVRPSDSSGCTINEQPVIRLRDQVLPLIDLRQRLNKSTDQPARFALIVNAAGQRAGLLLDRLIGQQDIVIKPLDDAYTKGGPFSGATIQDTGDVSLILDVPSLVRQAHGPDSPSSRQAA